MSSSLLERASVTDEVGAFLVRHDARREMEALYQLIEHVFPAARSLDVWLQDDPDEEGRRRIVLSPILPPATAANEVALGIREFHDGVCGILSPAKQGLFSLVPDFSA